MALIDFTGFEDGQLPPSTGASFIDLNVSQMITSPVRTGGYSVLMSTASGAPWNSGMRRSLTSAEKHATLIIGGAMRFASTDMTINLFGFGGDAGVTAHLNIRKISGGEIEVRLGTQTGTVLGTSAAVLTGINTWYYVEAKVVLHDTTGSVEVRVDGATVLSLTGIDTRNGGTDPTFDTAYWGCQSTNNMYWDDVYICNGDATAPNDFLNAPRVQPMLPNGNGSTNQYVGSDGDSTDNYLLVDERPPSMTDYTQSATAGERDLYAMGDVSFATNDSVEGVRVAVRVQNADASTRNLKLGVKSGATVNMDAGQSIGTGSALSLYRMMQKNPVTTGSWTQSEVNALEMGTEIV